MPSALAGVFTRMDAMCRPIDLVPHPKPSPPITFVRKRQTKPQVIDPAALEALQRAYLSGVADGLTDADVFDTLYPDAVAARYALGYSRGRAWRR